MRRLLLTLFLLLSVCCSLNAQFRSTRNDVSGQKASGTVTGPPGSEMNNTAAKDTSAVTDTVQGFSIRRLIRGYAGRDTLTPGYMVLGSAIVPGAAQLYNKDYWKVPIVYAGMGAGIYGGIRFNKQYRETGLDKYKYMSTASFIAAGAFYWAQLLDGVVCYKTDFRAPVPAKSTIYSILLPGLGQIYNGEAWKVPLYLGLIAGGAYFWHDNNVQYQRWKWTHNMATTDDETVERPPQTGENAKHYRDVYRRYRDYSVLATALFYLIQVIDANVFAYMQDFEVSEDLSLRMQPAVLPTANYAIAPPAVGMTIGLKF